MEKQQKFMEYRHYIYLKILGEDMDKLPYEIITKSYKIGDIPKKFVKIRTIVLPKKGTSMKSSNYRVISITLYYTITNYYTYQYQKILLGIIKERIKNSIKQYVSEDQFGFRSEKGTREAILALRTSGFYWTREDSWHDKLGVAVWLHEKVWINWIERQILIC